MMRPFTTDPLAHAQFNARIAEADGVDLIDLGPFEVTEAVCAAVDADARYQTLLAAVMRAVDELEGQGARSDRIALQLLTAVARLEAGL